MVRAKRAIILFAILSSTAVLSQNCVFTGQSSSLQAGSGGGNGDGYEGKVYQSYQAGGACPDGSNVSSEIHGDAAGNAILVRDNCVSLEPRIFIDPITKLLSSLGFVVYRDRIFYDPSAPPPSAYRIVARHSSECLQAMPGSAIQAPTAILQEKCQELPEQLWYFEPTQEGNFVVRSAVTARCLGIPGDYQSTFSEGTPVEQHTCNGFNPKANEIMQAALGDDGSFHLRVQVSTQCVQIKDASVGDGAPIEQGHCEPAKESQRFEIVNAGEATDTLAAAILAKAALQPVPADVILANAGSNSAETSLPPNLAIDDFATSCFGSIERNYQIPNEPNPVKLSADIADASAGPIQIGRIRLQARMINGVPFGFPANYFITLLNADGTESKVLGPRFDQPNRFGVVEISDFQPVAITGIRVTGNALGFDEFGSHRMQLCEMQVFTPAHP